MNLVHCEHKAITFYPSPMTRLKSLGGSELDLRQSKPGQLKQQYQPDRMCI